MPRTGTKCDRELPGSEQIFRYWVEVLELKNGSVRNLPQIDRATHQPEDNCQYQKRADTARKSFSVESLNRTRE
jgi:hypothetical protein